MKTQSRNHKGKAKGGENKQKQIKRNIKEKGHITQHVAPQGAFIRRRKQLIQSARTQSAMNLKYAAVSSLLAGFCICRTILNTSNPAQALAYLLASKASMLVHTLSPFVHHCLHVHSPGCGAVVQLGIANHFF